MKNVLLAALLGAVVAFVWSSVSWIVLPWHNAVIHEIYEEEALKAVMMSAFPETGIYYFPSMTRDGQMVPDEEYTDLHARGPLAMIVYNAEGKDALDALVFIKGFILVLVSAFIAAFLLSLGAGVLSNYWARVFAVFLVGVFAVFTGPLMEWNWFYYPDDYTIVAIFDTLVTWFLAGLVIAWKVKPDTAAA